VRVGPYVFRVVRKPGMTIADEKVGDSSVSLSRIRYADGPSPMQIRATILHEVLHAVALTAAITSEDKLAQEEWISRIESGLLGVIRDNPELIGYLTASDVAA
jgi:hypothetical protein